jgi:hypothetical protein
MHFVQYLHWKNPHCSWLKTIFFNFNIYAILSLEYYICFRFHWFSYNTLKIILNIFSTPCLNEILELRHMLYIFLMFCNTFRIN